MKPLMLTSPAVRFGLWHPETESLRQQSQQAAVLTPDDVSRQVDAFNGQMRQSSALFPGRSYLPLDLGTRAKMNHQEQLWLQVVKNAPLETVQALYKAIGEAPNFTVSQAFAQAIDERLTLGRLFHARG